MAAWRAMPDGGKGGSYKLQLYHEKHPHQGTPKKRRERKKERKEIRILTKILDTIIDVL